MTHTKLSDRRVQRALGFRVQPNAEHAAVRFQPIVIQSSRSALWVPSIVQLGYLALTVAIVAALAKALI